MSCNLRGMQIVELCFLCDFLQFINRCKCISKINCAQNWFGLQSYPCDRVVLFDGGSKFCDIEG